MRLMVITSLFIIMNPTQSFRHLRKISSRTKFPLQTKCPNVVVMRTLFLPKFTCFIVGIAIAIYSLPFKNITLYVFSYKN